MNKRIPGLCERVGQAHAEQGHDVPGPVELGGEAQGHRLPVDKAGVVLGLDRVLIGAVIQHLLHLPQVPGGGHHIEEKAPRSQHPGELLRR